MPKKTKPQARAPRYITMTMAGGRRTAVVNISGIIGWNDSQALNFCAQIDEAVASGAEEIEVRINSNGGDVFTALAMLDKLRSTSIPVRTEAHGIAASAASLLLMAGDTRCMTRNTTLMIHQPSAGVWGTVDEIISYANYLAQNRRRIFAIYGDACGQTAEQMSEAHRIDQYYTAEQALSLGLIDQILEGGDDENNLDENGNPVNEDGDTRYDENGNPINEDDDIQYDENGNPISEDDDTRYDEDGNPINEGDDTRYDEDGNPISEGTENDDDPASPSCRRRPAAGRTGSMAMLRKLCAGVGIRFFAAKSAASRRQPATAAGHPAARSKTAARIARLEAQNRGLRTQLAKALRDNAPALAALDRHIGLQTAGHMATLGLRAEDLPAASEPQAPAMGTSIRLPSSQAEWDSLSKPEKMAVAGARPDIAMQFAK